MNNNRTCETCKFFCQREKKETTGLFRKRTKITSLPTCLRFGVHGIDAYIARLRIESHFNPHLSEYTDVSYKLTKGPCGPEGKFWEKKD